MIAGIPVIPASRELDPLSFTAASATASQRLTANLERGRVLRAIRIRVVLNITVTTAGPGAYHQDSPHRVVSSIRIKKPGGDPRLDTDGYALEVVRQSEGGTPSYVSQPAISAATYDIEMDMSYAFAPANSPFEDAWGLILPNSGEDSVEITVNPSLLFSTAPTAWNVNSVTAYITQEEDAAENAAERMAALSPLGRPLVRHLISSDTTLTSAGDRQSVPASHISEGGHLEACWFINRTGATPVRADGHVDRFTFRYGGVQVAEEDYPVAYRRQKAVTGLETLLTGVLYHQFDRSRLLQSAFLLRGASGTRFHFDTSAATSPQVQLLRSEVYGQTPGR